MILRQPTSQPTLSAANLLLLLLLLQHQQLSCSSFSLHSSPQKRTAFSTLLFMGKAHNKQADLKRKMDLAKKQRMEDSDNSASSGTGSGGARLTAAQQKEANDRLRFDQLLKTNAASVLNDYSSDGYLNKNQEEEEITAALKGVDRLFEGDPAPTDCFQELVSIKSENAIGVKGAERLVPWLRKSQQQQNDYLVILTDPRQKSPELRQTVKSLLGDLTPDILNRMVIINADSPAENRRWLKKSGIADKVEVYSDEKMEWIRAYTALGQARWSMTMFIIANERVERLARDVDAYGATRTIRNAVKSLGEARL